MLLGDLNIPSRFSPQWEVHTSISHDFCPNFKAIDLGYD